MKVVHINTYDSGGAAASVLRLHSGLLEQQVNSFFLSLYKNDDNYPNKLQYKLSCPTESYYQRIKNKLGFRKKTQAEKNHELVKDIKGQYEIYTFPLSDYRVEEHPLIREADIIHLHWVANFINYPTFFPAIKKPVVWTLHDMNPFLGGFHYSQDVTRNETQFKFLEKKLTQIKTKSIAEVNDLTIVTPSYWLGESAKESNTFKNACFRRIPYGLNSECFKPFDLSFARSVFRLPLEKKIVLFVCQDLDNYRKGFDMLREAARLIDLKDLLFVVTGEATSFRNFTGQFYSVGRIQDERLMSVLYSAADLVVVPSREDNLPNVMLEAFACGTPVLSCKVGGMLEFIEPGINGFFADDITAKSLAKAFVMFDNGKYIFDRVAIRNYAEKNFTLKLQASEYIKLYEQCLYGKNSFHNLRVVAER